jgi:hypothetical protein
VQTGRVYIEYFHGYKFCFLGANHWGAYFFFKTVCMGDPELSPTIFCYGCSAILASVTPLTLGLMKHNSVKISHDPGNFIA